MIGARHNRDWWDSGPYTPPEKPPQLRAVLLVVAAFAVLLGALAVGGGAFLQWWRGA